LHIHEFVFSIFRVAIEYLLRNSYFKKICKHLFLFWLRLT